MTGVLSCGLVKGIFRVAYWFLINKVDQRLLLSFLVNCFSAYSSEIEWYAELLMGLVLMGLSRIPNELRIHVHSTNKS